MKKRHSLQFKFGVALLLFAIALAATLTIFVGLQYTENVYRDYEDLTYTYAEFGAEHIDGAKVLNISKAGTPDADREYYDYVYNMLAENIAQSTDLVYYYVIVPEEDGFYYLWDADDPTKNNSAGVCEFGEYVNYDDQGKETYEIAYSDDPYRNMLVTPDQEFGYVCSAFVAIRLEDGTPVALVGADVSAAKIVEDIWSYVKNIIMAVIVTTALGIVLLNIYIRLTIIKPIRVLRDATHKVVNSVEMTEDFSVNINTKDEIEDLSEAFEQMTIDIKEYINMLSNVIAEKQKMTAELDVAARIQKQMLPVVTDEFRNNDKFEIYASMQPAKEVGGDFYDFFMIDDDHMAMMIADVSGKGIPAALFMAISKTLLHNGLMINPKVGDIMNAINNILIENNKEEFFVTVWCGLYELSTGKITCVNAGHEYPFIARRDNEFELYKDKHGMVMAGIENAKYKEYELTLEPGDVLYLYTDGVAEATNLTNELFGTDRMRDSLNKSDRTSTENIAVSIKKDVDEFVGIAPQFDDMTMLIFKRKS